ncbi:solute carrier family 22 member 20 isoform X2 [Talpa occidentalis]|uniref:solute carrier family 22 member 20 isoform X2 n=1 Tax=Talpa occidentalis TaxID=50954 RepID=UPI0018908AED|nr:solute carrier family 22 member 20 isoform X2 [Talpa occidentalis]
MEWDLVCEARTLRDLAQSIYMAGVLVGAAVFGSLADRLGRKAPLVWSYLQLAASGAATAYFSSFGAYCAFRFLMGMTFSGIILNSLSLVVEWMPTRGRTVAGILLGYSFTLGQLILAGVAYLIRPWRWLQFAVSLPFLVFFLYSWWLPESSRWLLLQGKSQLAVQNLRKVAAINGRKEEGERLTKEVVSSYIQSEFASVRTSNSFLDLFRTPAIRKVSCCLMMVWFSNSMAYYGLAMDLQKFGLSVYLVQVLFGVIDIPAMLVATTTMIYVGRRATVASFLILAGLMVISNMFVPEESKTAPPRRRRRKRVKKFPFSSWVRLPSRRPSRLPRASLCPDSTQGFSQHGPGQAWPRTAVVLQAQASELPTCQARPARGADPQWPIGTSTCDHQEKYTQGLTGGCSPLPSQDRPHETTLLIPVLITLGLGRVSHISTRLVVLGTAPPWASPRNTQSSSRSPHWASALSHFGPLKLTPLSVWFPSSGSCPLCGPHKWCTLNKQ